MEKKKFGSGGAFDMHAFEKGKSTERTPGVQVLGENTTGGGQKRRSYTRTIVNQREEQLVE